MKLKSTLFFIYLFVWILLSINPSYRDDWLLENIMVFLAVPLILWVDRKIHFSDASVWMLFIFFVLHSLGAHYTYSEMPWFEPITQFFGFERNHYDRLIHFLFGLLLFEPFYEFFIFFQNKKMQAILLTFLFLSASSGMYEIIEWIATEVTHAELGTAFLGMQGDAWDTQKDMAFGYLGSLLAMVFIYFKHKRRRLTING